MIPLGGMSTILALRVVDTTRAQQLASVQKTPEHERAITAFRDRIANVTTAEQLVDDHEAYSFVMKAFDLEDQMFGKAMIKKILESDVTDQRSLVNRLTDPRFRELHKVMGFTAAGTANANTKNTIWQNKMVDRYVERQFINGQSDQNEVLGTVLEVRRNAPNVTTWFDVLKDKQMGEFMRTSLGIPDSVVQLDIDRQAAIFAEKFDITKLKDPQEVEKLTLKYVAITDALNPGNAGPNAAIQIMNNVMYSGNGNSFVPATLDISMINFTTKSIYR